MATDPRSLTINDTPTAKAFAAALQATLNEIADHTASQMIQIHPRIVARLRGEGLDERGRFGGSSARKTASAIIKPGQKIADFCAAGARGAQGFALIWEELYATPIAVAEQMKARNGQQMMGR